MTHLDVWTLGHAGWGVAFAFKRMTLGWVLAAACAWEWFENTVLAPVGWGEGGNHVNSAFDIVAAALACGCIVAAKAAAQAKKGERAKAVLQKLDEWDQ